MNKLSYGLNLILKPLRDITLLPISLIDAMRRAGKRGKQATLYPTDLRKLDVILESKHESGKVFTVKVLNNDVQTAIDYLYEKIIIEDYMIKYWY